MAGLIYRIGGSISDFAARLRGDDANDKADPQFDDQAMQQMEEFARRVFTDRLNGVKQPRRERENGPPPDYDENKHHEQHLCERCQELGYNCTRRRVDK